MDDRSPQTTIDRRRLSLLAAGGVSLGVFPCLLFWGWGYVVIAVFAFVAGVVVWKCRQLPVGTHAEPEPREWLLAAWNAVGVGAVAGLLGFAWYALAYGAGWAVQWVVAALGGSAAFDVAGFARFVAAVFLATFTLATPFMLVDELAGKLYPSVAGTRSAYFPMASQRWKPLLMVGVGLVGLAASLTLTDGSLFWRMLVATVLLFATGVPVLGTTDRRRPTGTASDVVAALSRLVHAAGYEATPRPRTGSAEVDPLLASVDLLARAARRAYVFKVKVVDSSETTVDWSSASDVRTAAKVLQREMRKAPEPPDAVAACLLVIGGTIGEDLEAFCREEGVRLVHVAQREVLRWGLASNDPGELRTMARDVLHLEPADPPIAAGGVVAGTTP